MPKNFLQEHYERYRLEGGDHAMYAIVNDLSDEAADELGRWFKSNHPEGVPGEKTREFAEKLGKESAEAAARDDLAWLTGTGRFGQ